MPLTTQPFAQSPELETVRSDLNINVPQNERIGSIAAGIGLLLFGASRRSLGGGLLALAGAALIRRGATGHCDVYHKLGLHSARLNTEAGVPGNKGIKVVQNVTVDRAPAEVYHYWRKLENLPRFMEHVEKVEELDRLRSHWVVKGPAATHLEWNARIVTDHENELISWESLPGAEVQNAGSVRFEPLDDGAKTNVRVTLQYQPPAGALGAAVAKLFGEAPDQQLTNDLAKFKMLLETNAVPAA